MDAKEYQNMASEFATYGSNPMYPLFGLAEEAGEVCGKVAKHIRKHNGLLPLPPNVGGPLDVGFRNDIAKELGDCLWMIAAICTDYGLDLGSVMEQNIAKLKDRKARGVILGEGDNR